MRATGAGSSALALACTLSWSAAATQEAPAPSGAPSDARPIDPPAEPKPSDQRPRPVWSAPADSTPSETVEIGLEVGSSLRPAKKHPGVEYEPGFLWGAYARINVIDELAVRIVGRREQNGVTLDEGAFGLNATTLDQPDYRRTYIGAYLEPTLNVSSVFRAWLVVGAAWARNVADPMTGTGQEDFALRPRSNVLVEFPLGIGASFELIPDWMVLSFATTAGFLANQTGTLFRDTQAIDSSGQIVSLGEMPEFATSFSAVAGLGLLL